MVEPSTYPPAPPRPPAGPDWARLAEAAGAELRAAARTTDAAVAAQRFEVAAQLIALIRSTHFQGPAEVPR